MATLVHSWVARVTDGLSSTLLDSLWSSPASPPSTTTTTTECASDAATACAADTLTREYMESLQSQTHDAAHPVMPHAPVVVAAASCEDVVLRWRSVDHDARWPIHGYIVQRIPDTRHQLQWETMLDGTTNASDATDRNVKDTHQYLYRVQAVSGTARSHYAYHAVAMNQSACAASRTLMMYLPPALQSVPFLSTLSIEAVQTFVLIISCFLAVFGIVRSNVRRVQRTQSRKGRLREMKKATMAETQHSSSFSSYTTLPRLSSSDVSTEPATSVTDLPGSSRSLLESAPSLGSLSATRQTTTASPNFQRAASFSASLDKGVCAYCNKKFGIFRRRRVCDVCEAVALCRKCGSQAPVEVDDVEQLRQSVHMHRMSELDRDALAATRPHAKKTKHKVKTICRDCGDHALRFSTTNAGATRRLR